MFHVHNITVIRSCFALLYGRTAGNWRRTTGFGYVDCHWRVLSVAFSLMTQLREGDQAPDFDLEADDGSRVSLQSLAGRNVVLFFYPRDNTSG